MTTNNTQNDKLMESVNSSFRRTYSASYAWVDSIGAHLCLPGLRGFWPTSSMATPNILDLSGQARTLSNAGAAQGANFPGLAPSLFFDGANDYLTRADEAGLDILGNESYIVAANQGLSMGGWFRFSSLSAVNTRGIMGKWDSTTNNRSYLLYIDPATARATFAVSPDGIASPANVQHTNTLVIDQWYHICATFDPSTETAIYINGERQSTLAAVPATIFNSAATFTIMANNAGAAATRNHGYASLCWLSCMHLPPRAIGSLYHLSRALFGG